MVLPVVDCPMVIRVANPAVDQSTVQSPSQFQATLNNISTDAGEKIDFYLPSVKYDSFEVPGKLDASGVNWGPSPWGWKIDSKGTSVDCNNPISPEKSEGGNVRECGYKS